MKTLLRCSLLALLLAGVAPSLCFAESIVTNLSIARARVMGIDVRSRPGNGPDAVFIEVEFSTEGPLADFRQADLEVRQGGKSLARGSLREKRPTPGRVVVSFSADGGRLDDLTLWVVAGPPEGTTAYQLRMKDFVGLEKAK